MSEHFNRVYTRFRQAAKYLTRWEGICRLETDVADRAEVSLTDDGAWVTVRVKVTKAELALAEKWSDNINGGSIRGGAV